MKAMALCVSMALAACANGPGSPKQAPLVASPSVQAQPRDRTSNVGLRILDFRGSSGGREQTLTVAVWYPTRARSGPHRYGGPTIGDVAVDGDLDTEGGPYPLLVFSHGYGGSGLGAVFLQEELAGRGWIVVAPDHNDRYSAVRIRAGQLVSFDRAGLLRHARQIASSGPEDRGEYLYRLDEMKLALDGILSSPGFGPHVDREKIAVGGHSFGGFTALGLCGTLDDRRDPRIKAVLLFSTGAAGYLFTEQELAKVEMPSMFFLGEREKEDRRGRASMAELAEKAYGSFHPPKYFLEIKGASHFSFNNRFSDTPGARWLSGTEEQLRVVRSYSIAFLERHVLGKKSADRQLGEAAPGLVRYSSE